MEKQSCKELSHKNTNFFTQICKIVFLFTFIPPKCNGNKIKQQQYCISKEFLLPLSAENRVQSLTLGP